MSFATWRASIASPSPGFSNRPSIALNLAAACLRNSAEVLCFEVNAFRSRWFCLSVRVALQHDNLAFDVIKPNESFGPVCLGK